VLLGRGTDNADVVVVDSATGKTIKVIRNADPPGVTGTGTTSRTRSRHSTAASAAGTSSPCCSSRRPLNN